MPDCVRAVAAGTPVVVRRPDALRPWQQCSSRSPGISGWARACWPGRRARRAWNLGPDAAGAWPWGCGHGLPAAYGAGAWHPPAPSRQSRTRPGAHPRRSRRRTARCAAVWTVDRGRRAQRLAWYRQRAAGGDARVAMRRADMSPRSVTAARVVRPGVGFGTGGRDRGTDGMTRADDPRIEILALGERDYDEAFGRRRRARHGSPSPPAGTDPDASCPAARACPTAGACSVPRRSSAWSTLRSTSG